MNLLIQNLFRLGFINKIGPFEIGDEWFDTGCDYGNKIKMNPETLKHLKFVVSNYDKYKDQPYYVCRMKSKHIHPTEGKMVCTNIYFCFHFSLFFVHHDR